MEISKLEQPIVDRRANANAVTAGFLVGFCGLFASVPISVRQKDWRVWALPFAAACSLITLGALSENSTEKAVWNLMGWGAQGALAGVFIAENKKQALARR